MGKIIETQIIVIGAGLAGYTVASKCSLLGYKVIIVEKNKNFGGVCLNYGCIPSKYFIDIAKVLEKNKYLYEKNILLNKIKFNLSNINLLKKKIIKSISLDMIKNFKNKNILILYGKAKFINKNLIEIVGKKRKVIKFKFAIIATGSVTKKIHNIPKHNNIWYSDDALKFKFIPKKFLIIGIGVIGLEIANFYKIMGSSIDILDESDLFMPFLDKDISNYFYNLTKNKFNYLINYKILSISDDLYVTSVNKSNGILFKNYYDAILIAVGRRPNVNNLGLKKIKVKFNKYKGIYINENFSTNIPHIYAIGDVIGLPMLAHKAIYQGKILAGYLNGLCNINWKTIPNIIYCNPEIAYVGLNELEAKNLNINYCSVTVPWRFIGRSYLFDYKYGLTKLIFNRNNNKIIGGVILGFNSGELLGELSLAIEMGCNAEDLSLVIHSHPTFYESISIAVDMYFDAIN